MSESRPPPAPARGTAPASSAPTLVVWVLVVVLLLCCCSGGIVAATSDPSIRLMCRVSDTACAAFCRSAPAECDRLKLPRP